MAKCDYHRICGTRSVCYGIKNVEECSCGGDTCKCDFYPEKRSQKRLIDANALKANFVVLGEFANDLWYAGTIRMAIDNAPTVDAVEVVHGWWKYYHKQNIAVCTNCSFERDLDANFGKAVSCPNCGAKMDGERKDND